MSSHHLARISALALFLAATMSGISRNSALQADEVAANTASATEVPNLALRQRGFDWPDFLGPHRDGKSTESGILTKWRPSGLPIVWSKRLGEGYGIGSIYRGRYFQVGRFGDMARIECLKSETGEQLWRFEYPTQYEDLLGYNNGPRCTPVVDGDRIYILGADGVLLCLRAADGKLVWRRNTSQDYGVVQNFFGVGSTPLILGDLLIMLVGGSPADSPNTYSGRVRGNGSGIVAFDKFTGKEKYRLTDELASYSSPVQATIDGQSWCFVFARGGLVGFNPRSGELGFQFPWRSTKLESVNAATPIVVGNRVFISETYGPGSAMLRIAKGKHKVVWQDEPRTRKKSMLVHWNTPIHHDGYIYASSGRHTSGAELRCIRAADGEVQWSEPGLARCSLLYVDGHLVCLSEDGVLRLLRATPKKYELAAEMIPRGSDGIERLLDYPAWAAPILSHGLLYVRGKSRVLCLELIPEKR